MTEWAKEPGAGSLKRRDSTLSAGVDAVLLLGRSGHQGAAGEGMEFLAEAVRATDRYLAVRTAIAERGLASLPEGLEACAQAGARKILVIPVFFGRDRSLIHWLSKTAYRWSRARGEPALEVVFAGAIGEHPTLGEAVVRAVADAEGEAPVRADDFQKPGGSPRLVRDTAPRAARARLPGGTRCTSRGAGGLYVHFWKRLQERGLLRGRSGVHAAQTGCLSPCNLGPTIVVYPESIWYCGLTAEAIDLIVDKHFVGGRVVEEYARESGRHERLKGER